MSGWHPGALAVGVFFVLMGGVFLLEAAGAWDLGPAQVWPLLLIGLGVAVLVSGAVRGGE